MPAKELSAVVFEVAPCDEDTNMDELELRVRKIEREGLKWGEATREAVVGSIFKLKIVAAIEESVSVEDIIETIEAWDDLVQHADVASFVKM